MASHTSFQPDSLAREIARRGLTTEQFAEEVGVNSATIYRALKGLALRPGSFGKILITLGRIPVIEAPADLVQTA